MNAKNGGGGGGGVGGGGDYKFQHFCMFVV